MTAETELKLSELQAAELLKGLEGVRISIPVKLIRLLGNDLAAAAFLHQAAFLSGISLKAVKSGREGWFDLPQTGAPRAGIEDEEETIFARLGSWESTLGIGPDAQLAARRKLINKGLLEERRNGIPARTHYRVLPSVYLAFLASSPSFGNSGNKKPESKKQDSEDPDASNRETTKQQSENPETNLERVLKGFNTTTTDSEGGGSEESPPVEDLVQAAVWWEKQAGRQIKKLTGFKAVVRARVTVKPSDEDLETWRLWCEAMSASADERRAEELVGKKFVGKNANYFLRLSMEKGKKTVIVEHVRDGNVFASEPISRKFIQAIDEGLLVEEMRH
jgi:hypothetical protein